MRIILLSDRTVLVSEKLGFCSGVESAINKAFEAAEKAMNDGLPCYFYGDIVHNKRVIAYFDKLSIKSIYSPEGVKPGVLIIRAHGIADSERAEFEAKGFVLVDATCPVVKHNQELVRKEEGNLLIVGYPKHAEVISLLGSTNKEAKVITSSEDIDSLDKSISYSAVLQTTFSDVELERIIKRAAERSIRISFLNSICSASRMRRLGVMKLCKSVDAFVVVGDRLSANTKELYELAKKGSENAFLIEAAEELPQEVFSYNIIGVTAGASTPKSVYQEAIDTLRSKKI